jgi:hypothetical protein
MIRWFNEKLTVDFMGCQMLSEIWNKAATDDVDFTKPCEYTFQESVVSILVTLIDGTTMRMVT